MYKNWRPKLSKKLLSFDLDGVLYPWHEAAYIHLRDFHGYTGDKDTVFTKGGFWESKNQMFQENFKRIEPLYYKFPPTRHLIDLMNTLAEQFTIMYITHRPKEVCIVTENYLEDFGFPNPNMVVYTEDKAKEVQIFGVDIFVEDQLNWASKLKGLCDVFIMSQPWNYEGQKEYRVIYSIDDLVKELVA